MPGDLDVTQERDPDFSALLRLHGGNFDTWVIEQDEGPLLACATIVVRPGWLGGEQVPVGYTCDLRFRPEARGKKILQRFHRLGLDHATERHGAAAFHTVIFDSNQRARRALLARDDLQGVRYRELTPFQMTSVQITGKKSPPGRKIEEASLAVLDELAEFLGDGQRLRPFGQPIDRTELERRLATWPGLRLEHFLIARDGRGRIAGCLAPWDSREVKRTRVLGYHRGMRWMRAGFDLAAKLRGFEPLPVPGDCFRFAFASHLEIAGDDPAVLHDLLLAAYARHRHEGLHFLAAMIPRGSPLERAFKGFMLQRTPMTLYSITTEASRWHDRDLATSRPGFEMALS